MDALWVNEVKNIVLAANQLQALILGPRLRSNSACALVHCANSNQYRQLN